MSTVNINFYNSTAEIFQALRLRPFLDSTSLRYYAMDGVCLSVLSLPFFSIPSVFSLLVTLRLVFAFSLQALLTMDHWSYNLSIGLL